MSVTSGHSNRIGMLNPKVGRGRATAHKERGSMGVYEITLTQNADLGTKPIYEGPD
jgi:hypothetical protein